MPGKVRVKIIAGRNLPVMDRSNDTADAFVEIKLANITYKTDVYRKSLNPQWNTDFYRFELDDADLQDEPLQIRLMDHDTYTANDAIGKVSISLNPLLLPNLSTSGQTIVSEKGAVMAGWIPVFDTMHGIRGEVNIVVKVDLFSDVNKFRQSSCGIKFFHSPNIPHGYHAQMIHGFVEELVVNDDPEYQWIDKIRTPRASNDARQLVFLRLSGQVQRKIGLKAIDLGANAVIGYTQCFDLEGDVGVVARGIGTAVTLERNLQTQQSAELGISEDQIKYLEFLKLCDQKPQISSKFDSVTIETQDASNSMFDRIESISSPTHDPITMARMSFQHGSASIDGQSADDLSPLKMLLEQEDNRGRKYRNALKSKMQRIGKSSKTVINRKILRRKSRDDTEFGRITHGLTESLNELTLRYSPTSTLRSSITDVGGAFKKKKTDKFERSSSDGAGMAALLVSSMMAASSLKCIRENHDTPTADKLPAAKDSLIVLSPYPSSICIKESDSNLSAYSVSSNSVTSSIGDESESLIRVDPETVSMVVKSVLAREQSRKDGSDWIRPSARSCSTDDLDEYSAVDASTIKTGGIRSKTSDKLSAQSTFQIVCMSPSTDEIHKFLAQPSKDPDAENWIQPGSTVDEPETNDTEHESMFHELKENLMETMHTLQEHIHIPDANEFFHVTDPNSHHHLSDGLQSMLKDQVAIVNASPSVVESTIVEATTSPNHHKSFRQRLTSFCKRTKASAEVCPKTSNALRETARKCPLIDMPIEVPTITLSYSLTDLKSNQLYGKNSYGSAIELNSPKTTTIKPFVSMPDLTLDLHHVVDLSGLNSIDSLRVGLSSHPKPNTTITTKTNTTPTTGNSNNTRHAVVSECAKHAAISTNPASLLAPFPLPKNRVEMLSAGNAAISATPTVSGPTKSVPIASTIKKDHGHVRAESSGCKITQQQSPAKVTSNHMTSSMGTASTAVKEKDSVCRRSSDSDLSVTPKGNSFNESRNLTQIYPNRSSNKIKLRPLNPDNIDMLEYPFLTLSKYPKGFIMHIGATVCARSVKLLERVPNPDEPETRDSWWTELRMEIRSHARALGCNVILGYSEITSISDDVCVLSVTGTAAVINLMFTSGEIGLLNTTLSKASIGETDVDAPLKKSSPPKSHGTTSKAGLNNTSSKPSKTVELDNGAELSTKKSTENEIDCSICHIPYSRSSAPFNEHMKKCAICKNGIVPDVLLATVEIPDSIEITGHGCFLQAQVCRTKKDLKSESNAKEISDCLPFLEYDLHRLLINKLKSKGMNAIFGLRSSVTIGEKVIALIATGTAVFLKALPAPTLPKIIAGNSWTNIDKLNELQKSLQETVDRNREIYQLKSKIELECNESSDESDDDSNNKNNEINLNINNKGTFVLEVDDVEDLDIITMLMEPSPPEGFHVVNTQSVPGMQHLEVARNLQMFTQIWRAKLSCNQQGSINFAKHFQRLLQTIFFKLRTMIPCAICDLRFRLELPDTDEIQLLVTGMALGLSKPKPPESKPIESAHDSGEELMFRLEEENQPVNIIKHHNSDLSTTGRGASFNDGPSEKYSVRNQFPHSGSLKLGAAGRPHRVMVAGLAPVRERYGVELTPLSYVPGGSIRRYLGNLNFFFIRESTSIRESGGVSGFVHSFVTEMLAVVRAHVTALGGNALISFYMTELALVDNPHKNQGQCLISVGGDVVFVSYFTGE